MFEVIWVDKALEFLNIFVDLIFEDNVFFFRAGIVFLFWNCSNDLFQFIEFLLEGFDFFLTLHLKFEFVAEALQFLLEPELIQLAFEMHYQLLGSLTIDLLVLN